MDSFEKIAKIVTNGVMFCAIIFVLSVWSVVGFFFWIPLLARTTVMFTILLSHAIITGQKSQSLHNDLAAVSGFWFNGFRIFWNALYAPSSMHESGRIQIKGYERRIVIEGLWSVFCWLFTLLMIGRGVLASMFSWVPDIVQRDAFVFGRESIICLFAIGVAIFIIGIISGMIISANLKQGKGVDGDSTHREDVSGGLLRE